MREHPMDWDESVDSASAFLESSMAAGKVADPVSEKVMDALRDVLAKESAAAEAESTPRVAPSDRYTIPKEPPTPKELVLKPGQVSAKALIKEAGHTWPRDTEDFGVTILTEWPEQMKPFIATRDMTYDPDVEQLLILLRAIETGDKVLITGPTGCGKSQLVRHAGWLTKRPLVRINMTEDAESSVIFGTMVARSGSTYFEDGPATEAWKYGALLNVDEWDVTPSGVSMGFQWMLEDNGRLFLKEMPGAAADKIIAPHPQARLIMCGNTVGQGDETGSFSGVQPQNSAMVDRFQTTMKMNYMQPAREKAMLEHALEGTGVTRTDIERMVKLAGLVREAHGQRTLPITMSPRTLLNWGRKQAEYGMKGALQVAYLNKLTDVQRKVVDAFIAKVYG